MYYDLVRCSVPGTRIGSTRVVSIKCIAGYPYIGTWVNPKHMHLGTWVPGTQDVPGTFTHTETRAAKLQFSPPLRVSYLFTFYNLSTTLPIGTRN